MIDQTVQITYIGTEQRWPELSITGRQSIWMPGQIESRSNVEAASLLATGLFSSPPVPVTAVTSPGGVVRNSFGELVWQRGHNRLVRTHPDGIVSGVTFAGVQAWSSTSLINGATAQIDPEATCPISGLATVSCVMPPESTGLNRMNWASLPNVQCAADDVWIVSVWLSKIPDYVELYLVENQTGSWSNKHRHHRWSGEMLRLGWNILHARHVEHRVGATEYGVVGTSWQISGSENVWVDQNGMTGADTIGQLRVGWANMGGETVKIGGVYKAPRRWATGVICWSADDVPKSFLQYAIPVIESYGWRTTLNVTSTLTAGSPTHITAAVVAALAQRGHEIWGHTATHVNMATADEQTRARELRESAKFFAARGLESATRFLAWPYLEQNADAAAAAKAAGYALARGYRGRYMSPLAPLVEPYNLPSYSAEVANSWHVDTAINRAAEIGLTMVLYMHNAVPGGAGSDTYPGPVQFYIDHLIRWCERVKTEERAGRLEVMTVSDAIRSGGLDPYTAVLR